ncbi:MAG: DUF924 family protein [Pseudotabrizicola sp.]|uniref:DUF924 family protein n=1 Tax=Pseudotabrizicola sp. TaxID=2939647 RepID=UPI002719FDA9|nr:DUF924 family protein [Pseudotabrizicola sp.]MDO8883988.1 DUF924 family protein [Pseudotabrizicola sp.]MDP2082741.1 DUF924 family protein [Pseudotabrizicola sp.]MDZ7576286.1 DUF924 family protein [Pseudotabrizicola sp.]
MSDPVEVLDFWLGEIGPEGWYAGSEEIDDACAVRFGALWDAQNDGGLEHWVDGVVGTLAYLIVADQFSRNIHRGKAQAFANDPRARDAARRALEAGWDMQAPVPERQFFYMPFEHSEDMADQDLAVSLMAERMEGAAETLLHARAHREIIARFGRFPFRNAALGRDSTADEAAFMADGGYMKIVNKLRDSYAPGA